MLLNLLMMCFFDVWDKNFSSQKAVAKLGAKIYNRDVTRNNLVFRLTKKDWQHSIIF